MRPSIVMHQREPRTHCTSTASSRYLMTVRVPLASTWRAVRPSKEMPPHTITDPPPKCWRMLQAAEGSPWRLQTLSRLSRAQCELALIREEHRAPLVNLPILVFSGKCQSPYMVLGCKHKPHLWTSGPHTTLKETCILVACWRSFCRAQV